MAVNDPSNAGPGAPKSYRVALEAAPSIPARIDVSYGELHGMPAVFIADEDMVSLAKPFNLTLIGKFAVDRPSIADIRKFVVRMKFFGFVKVDNHDTRNVVFRFMDERDYMRFFARRVYSVFGIQMRVTKWSPFLDVTEELPVMPLWIAFPGLRFHLYHLKTLMDIAKVFGKPLCVDSNTAAQNSLSSARVLVEVDVSVAHPKWVWLGSKEKGAPQAATIENLPLFCSCCKKVGHVMEDCKVLDTADVAGDSPLAAPLLQWVPKCPGVPPGAEGNPSQASGASGGDCNHPGPPSVASFPNFTAFASSISPKDPSRVANGEISIPFFPPPVSSNPLSSECVAAPVDDAGVDFLVGSDPLSSAPLQQMDEGSILSVGHMVDPVGLFQPAPALDCSVVPSKPSSVVPAEVFDRSLGDIIDEILGPQAITPLEVSGSPDGSPAVLDQLAKVDVLLPESAPVELSVVEAPAVPRVGKFSKGEQLVDVQVALGGRFAILADVDGDSEESLLPRSCSAGKKGNKLLFSNSLNYGNLAGSPPPPRNTRSRARGRGRGALSKSESDGEGWALSKNGKVKGVHGPKAVALDALLNPQNLNV